MQLHDELPQGEQLDEILLHDELPLREVLQQVAPMEEIVDLEPRVHFIRIH